MNLGFMRLSKEHLFDSFHTGSLGELLAWIIAPIPQLTENDRRKWVRVLAVLTMPISMILFFPLWIPLAIVVFLGDLYEII